MRALDCPSSASANSQAVNRHRTETQGREVDSLFPPQPGTEQGVRSPQEADEVTIGAVAHQRPLRSWIRVGIYREHRIPRQLLPSQIQGQALAANSEATERRLLGVDTVTEDAAILHGQPTHQPVNQLPDSLHGDL